MLNFNLKDAPGRKSGTIRYIRMYEYMVVNGDPFCLPSDRFWPGAQRIYSSTNDDDDGNHDVAVKETILEGIS